MPTSTYGRSSLDTKRENRFHETQTAVRICGKPEGKTLPYFEDNCRRGSGSARAVRGGYAGLRNSALRGKRRGCRLQSPRRSQSRLFGHGSSGVEVSDVPGGLEGLLQVLCNAGAHVEYLYSFAGAGRGAVIIFHVDDMDGAEELLRQNGVETITETSL